jgi:uncharacterized membrane protein
MARWHRTALILFSLLTLVGAIAALYVEYRMLTDPTYSSFCNVNATVNCEQVLESAYSRVYGIPVAAGGAIWAGLVLILSVTGLGDRSEKESRVAAYIFVLATIGLAAVFYYGYTSFFVLKAACPLCLTMDAGIIGVFLVSAAGAGSVSALPKYLPSDLAAVGRNSMAATMTAVWLVASLALVFAFPKGTVAAAAETAAVPAAPLETLTPEQTLEWDRWLDAQPRVADVMPSGDVKVLVVKFNDYQCPACRATWVEYRGIIAKYEQQYPKVFKFQYHDFPLEGECGFGGMHQFACEAAVAVRLAQTKGKDRELGDYFYTHQDELSRDTVKKALHDIAGIDNFEEQYPKVLPAVHEDAVLGTKVGVNGTPTFFVNGIKFPSAVRPAYFDAAIAYALRKAGVQS